MARDPLSSPSLIVVMQACYGLRNQNFPQKLVTLFKNAFSVFSKETARWLEPGYPHCSH